MIKFCFETLQGKEATKTTTDTDTITNTITKLILILIVILILILIYVRKQLSLIKGTDNGPTVGFGNKTPKGAACKVF